jgi:hypothetical protein
MPIHGGQVALQCLYELVATLRPVKELPLTSLTPFYAGLPLVFPCWFDTGVELEAQ